MAKKKPTPKPPTLKVSPLAETVVALEKEMRKTQAGMASVVLSDRADTPKLAVILVDGPDVKAVMTALEELQKRWDVEAARETAEAVADPPASQN